jgi:hypothetical protein
MAASVLVGPLRAQADTAQPADPSIAALSKQIAKMEAEIQDLKKQLDEGKTNESLASAASPAPEESYPKINFHGFGDVNYTYSSNQAQFPNEFSLGELDFYITAQLAPNISFLTEDVVSADTTFNNWNVEAERMIFDYKFNKNFNVQVGRFHTEIGYYNTQFHHGTWLEMDTHRPWFLNFEDSGGILPVHMVGLSVDGAVPSGDLNLHYFVQVGNGRAYNDSASPSNPTQADRVANGRKAINLVVNAKPTWAPGVEIGAGLYHQVVSPEATVVSLGGVGGTDVIPSPGNLPSVREIIGSAYVVYSAKGINFMNEAFLINHTQSGGMSFNTFAGYSELSKAFGSITPYGRFTYVNSPLADPLFSLIQTAGLRYGPTVGLRYDFSDFACFKVQYDRNYQSNEQELAPINAVTFQVGFTF